MLPLNIVENMRRLQQFLGIFSLQTIITLGLEGKGNRNWHNEYHVVWRATAFFE